MRSTVKLRVAVASLPATSNAFTKKVCGPDDSGAAVYDAGSGLHATNPTSSMAQSDETASGLRVNLKVGVATPVVPVGPATTVTVGGTLSMVKANVSVGPVLPAASVPNT